jgi:hypothetical protein
MAGAGSSGVIFYSNKYPGRWYRSAELSLLDTNLEEIGSHDRCWTTSVTMYMYQGLLPSTECSTESSADKNTQPVPLLFQNVRETFKYVRTAHFLFGQVSRTCFDFSFTPIF